MTETERDREMWYCPRCQLWIGSELSRCNGERHPQPRFEIRQGDVPEDVVQASTVARAARVDRTAWRLYGAIRRWSA